MYVWQAILLIMLVATVCFISLAMHAKQMNETVAEAERESDAFIAALEAEVNKSKERTAELRRQLNQD